MGSLASLASAGVDHVTFFETTGWRGLMERQSGSPLPEKFPSQPGALFLLFHLFASIAGFRELAIAPATETRSVIAVGLFISGRLSRVLIGDLTGRFQKVRMTGDFASPRWTISPLSTGRAPAEWTTETRIHLEPYAIVRIVATA